MIQPESRKSFHLKKAITGRELRYYYYYLALILKNNEMNSCILKCRIGNQFTC